MHSYDCVREEILAEMPLTYLELSKRLKEPEEGKIVLALQDNNLRELGSLAQEGSPIRFLTTGDNAGIQTYRRSASFMLVRAIYELCGDAPETRVKIEFAAGKGLYANVDCGQVVDDAFAAKVEAKLREYVSRRIPFEKRTVSKKEAIRIFEERHMFEKAELFRFRRTSYVNLYSLAGFDDYCYGYMVPDTGYITAFGVYAYRGGLVLQLPERQDPEKAAPFVPDEKLLACQMEAAGWGSMMQVESISQLNSAIVDGSIQELILVQEALMEQKIGEIAREIAKDPRRKFIMIAGPSSSGKTSFSHRLSIQLRTLGLKPHPIGTDNYYVDREKTPRDENGEYNFECLEAVDVALFNSDMKRLLEGDEVPMPTFNFKTGKREYRGDALKLGPKDILVIEGIHGLNDKLSFSLPAENKFKIYISALTQLNIDDHNRITSTDGRLIRRMVRDSRTRGTSAGQTIAMWPSVNRGEREYIFPYQESADVVFNSALIYELAVLKQYAEPILYRVEEDAPEYQEAKRLLKFFDYFLNIDCEDIPRNSLLREFVGGSVFNVG